VKIGFGMFVILPILLVLGGRVSAAYGQNEDVASLKVKAGVVFKSGDVRPVARTDFFLLPASLEAISIEAAPAGGIKVNQRFDEWVDELPAVSREFRAWLKTHHTVAFLAALSDEVALDDLVSIPEFIEWLKEPRLPLWRLRSGISAYEAISKVPKYPKEDRDPKKQTERIQKFRLAIQKVMLTDDGKKAQWLSDMLFAIADRHKDDLNYNLVMRDRLRKALSLGATVAPTFAKAQTKTSLAGEAQIAGLKPGTYWISNLRPSRLGTSTILWDLKVTLEPGKTLEVELSNDNALAVENSEALRD